MRARLRVLVPGLLLALAFAGLEWFAFCNAAALARLYPAPIGLRYAQGKTGAEVRAVLEWMESDGNDRAVAPAFWQQQNQVALAGPAGESLAAALLYWGETNLVWPGEYTAGSAPGPWQTAGCAVSETLAWQLWGSGDPVGLTLWVNGGKRTVTGMFKEKQALILLPTEPEQAVFTGVELSADQPLSAEEARNVAQTCGLGLPDFTVYGGSMADLAALVGWLPATVLGAALLAALAAYSRAWPGNAHRAVWLGLAFCAALALPMLLAALPAWLLPSRWSDFSFWNALARQLARQINEWFSLPPGLREAAAKWLLARQALTGMGLALCTQRLLVRIREKSR